MDLERSAKGLALSNETGLPPRNGASPQASSSSGSSVLKVLLGTVAGVAIGAVAAMGVSGEFTESSSSSSSGSLDSLRMLNGIFGMDEFPVVFNSWIEERNIKNALGLIAAINGGTYQEEARNFYADESVYGTYIQHNPGLPDGIQPILDLVASFLPGDGIVSLSGVFAEADIVTLHYTTSVFGFSSIIVDHFKFNDIGTIIEHWDIIQTPVPAEQTESGNAMFPITTAPNGLVPRSPNTYMNRRTAIDAVTKYWNFNLTAVDTYFAEDYVEHSPTGGNGREGLRATLQNLIDQNVTATVDIGGVSAYGEYVNVFVRYDFNGWEQRPNVRLTDEFFRFENGLIVEHWDVSQDEVRSADTVSGRPMFPRF